MKVCVSCGGTGGHIFPGLATARELRSRGHEVILCLAGRDVEGASVDGWDGDVVSIKAQGFPTGLSLRAIAAAFRMLIAMFDAWRVLRTVRPDVVLGMGSYTSVGPVLAARLLSIPVVLHEANAVPGRATSFLSGSAARIGVAFPQAAKHLPEGKVTVTGFPLRKTLAATTPPRDGHDGLTLLVMGGSQGAHVLNEVAPQAVISAIESGARLRVIHLAGVRDADHVEKCYRGAGVDAEVHAFCQDMASIYSRVDFAVARAGAATCTELAVCHIPALFVPLPGAPRDHQTLNALAMASTGGMCMHPQRDVTVDWLAAYLRRLSASEIDLGAMREKLDGLVYADAASRLADLVETTTAKM